MPKKSSYAGTIPSSGQVLDAYWSSPVTRKEIQPIFDEYGEIMSELQTLCQSLDITVALITEKLGITPDEVKEFFTRKVTELQALKAEASSPAPEPQPSTRVTLD